MKKEVCLMCIVCFFLGYFVADVVSKCGFGREHLAFGNKPNSGISGGGAQGGPGRESGGGEGGWNDPNQRNNDYARGKNAPTDEEERKAWGKTDWYKKEHPDYNEY